MCMTPFVKFSIFGKGTRLGAFSFEYLYTRAPISTRPPDFMGVSHPYSDLPLLLLELHTLLLILFRVVVTFNVYVNKDVPFDWCRSHLRRLSPWRHCLSPLLLPHRLTGWRFLFQTRNCNICRFGFERVNLSLTFLSRRNPDFLQTKPIEARHGVTREKSSWGGRGGAAAGAGFRMRSGVGDGERG